MITFVLKGRLQSMMTFQVGGIYLRKFKKKFFRFAFVTSQGMLSLTSLERPRAHEVVSERFLNSQNENDMNYKNSRRIKFLVLVLREDLYWFSLNYINNSEAFGNNSE